MGGGRNAVFSKEEAETYKAMFDAYGVGVRAGGITPQIEDEKSFRAIMSLPDMTSPIENAWKEDGYARRPITLKSQVEFDAAADAAAGAAPTEDEDKQ